VRSVDRVELLALDVYQRANGRPITMTTVRDRLEQLRSHRPVCRCGLCGETVAEAKADRVYRTGSIWQRSVVATRARMTR
jgi:hypothetical protein